MDYLCLHVSLLVQGLLVNEHLKQAVHLQHLQ